MKFHVWVLALLLCGSLFSTHGAHAQDKEDGVIAVGGEILFRIYVPVAGRSITQRRESVEDNLVPILSEPRLTVADIKVIPFGGKPREPKSQRARIEVKKHFLINV